MAIWSEKKVINSKNKKILSGVNQEKDVAFYLRRKFKNSKDFIVFNDYSFEYDGEKAQIDHLIIHSYGFVILESKSIQGEVFVNGKGEWTRTVESSRKGIPSPIKQANLQKDLLCRMLCNYADKMLGKMLGIQESFGGRRWDVFGVVSNDSILHRNNMPNEINDKIIKSEDVGESVFKIGHKGLMSMIPSTDPKFTQSEILKIAEFLSEYSKGLNLVKKINKVSDCSEYIISCKKCGESKHISDKYGKYGYYIHCTECGTNTSMKVPCPECNSLNVRVNKSKNIYTLKCEKDHESIVFKY